MNFNHCLWLLKLIVDRYARRHGNRTFDGTKNLSKMCAQFAQWTDWCTSTSTFRTFHIHNANRMQNSN